MLETPFAVLAGRSQWAREPRYEVGAAVMTARLAFELGDVACSYADSLMHALFADGAAWVKVEAYTPELPTGRVLP